MTEGDEGQGRIRRPWRSFVRHMNRPLASASKAQLKAFDAALLGLVSLAALGAWAFQPVQQFASYGSLFLGAMLVAFGLIPGWILRREGAPVLVLWCAAGFVVCGAAVLFLTASEAVTRSEWNDRRCLRMQQAMLNPGPTTRTDLADVFSAMGCRPQGQGPKATYARTVHDGAPPTMEQIAAHFREEEAALVQEIRIEAKPPQDASMTSSARGIQQASLPRPTSPRVRDDIDTMSHHRADRHTADKSNLGNSSAP